MDGKKRIEEICEKVPALNVLYNARVRHYVIKDHTINVYNQFEKYFFDGFSKENKEEFILFLLLHDIGKSISYKNGNRQNQYIDSYNEVSKYGKELDISEDSMLLYKALLNSSYIGKYMENKFPLEGIYALIKEQSEYAKLELGDFFYLLSVYYQCDIASYTKDAGGYPYLEHLFVYKNGQKVYNEKDKLLEFSSVFQERYNELNKKIAADTITQKVSKKLKDKVDSTSQIGIKVVGKIDLSKLEKPKKEIKKNKENLYIIDTNVFVDCPEIITKINKKYPVILSAKVLDELDKLKSTLDNNGKRQVQKALKSINQNIDKRNLKMELADISLLPPDFSNRSADNLILTVALKFKQENPILLTSDNGLQIKAKGLKITTITLKEYLSQLNKY